MYTAPLRNANVASSAEDTQPSHSHFSCVCIPVTIKKRNKFTSIDSSMYVYGYIPPGSVLATVQAEDVDPTELFATT